MIEKHLRAFAIALSLAALGGCVGDPSDVDDVDDEKTEETKKADEPVVVKARPAAVISNMR